MAAGPEPKRWPHIFPKARPGTGRRPQINWWERGRLRSFPCSAPLVCPGSFRNAPEIRPKCLSSGCLTRRHHPATTRAALRNHEPCIPEARRKHSSLTRHQRPRHTAPTAARPPSSCGGTTDPLRRDYGPTTEGLAPSDGKRAICTHGLVRRVIRRFPKPGGGSRHRFTTPLHSGN